MAPTIRAPFGAGPNATITNIGVAGTGFTATEYGDESQHRTVLTCLAVTVGSPVAAASLGFGIIAYTLPVGAVVTKASYITMALSDTGGVVDANTPKVGLGTVVASGAVSVLSGTATFENIMAGQTAANVTGTATVKTVSTNLVIEAASAHTVYLNAAAAWAGADTVKATGTIVLEWSFIN